MHIVRSTSTEEVHMACRGSPREDASTPSDLGVVGTVMVRDVVSRAVVAHFRAHTAPLLVLQWDASGTLLVTASVHGHNINIFQVAHKPSPSYILCWERQHGRLTSLLSCLACSGFDYHGQYESLDSNTFLSFLPRPYTVYCTCGHPKLMDSLL